MTARGEAFAVRAPGFFGNRVAEWAPGTSAGQVFGWTFTLGGSSAMQAMSNSADLLSQLPRLRFTPAAGANNNGGLVPDQTTCWRGNAAGFGGFHFAARFALTTNVSNTRCFVGLSAQTATLCGASDPTAVNDTIGIGFVSGDNNTAGWRFIARDGTTATSLPVTGATRNATDVYELSILCAPNSSTMIVRFVDLTTGIVLIDDVEYGSADHIPRNTAFLSAHVEVGTAASGGQPTIDLVSMFLDVPDGARTWPGVLGRDGIYDVRDFGAVGDNTTADDAAFAAALRAMGMSGGGTLLVPPGTYNLDQDLVADLNAAGPLIIRGVAPGSGSSKSQLQFAAYRGIKIVGPKTGGAPSLAAAVEDLDILGGHFAGSGLRPPEHVVWEVSASYGEGDRVVVPGPRSTNADASFEYHYENVQAGTTTSGGSLATMLTAFAATQKPDPTSLWVASRTYKLNDAVRPPGATQFDAVFICTTAGTSGGAAPAWDYTLGNPTPDGATLVWTAYDASPYFIADGGTLAAPTGPVWACRVCAGIYAEARISVNRVLIEDFLNAGVHIQPPPSTDPRPNDADGSSITDAKIYVCGVGIVMRDSVRRSVIVNADISLYESDGGVTWTLAQTDRTIGYCERSPDGNTYVGGQVALCDGPIVYVPLTTNSSTFLGCYFEAQGPIDARSPKCSMWGGTGAGIFTSQCAFYGAVQPADWRNVVATGDAGGGLTIQAKLKPDASSVYGFAASDDATEYKHTYGTPTTGWWGLTHGASTAIAYSGANAAEGAGYAWAPNGIFVGGSKRMITNDTAAPTTGSWQVGDIVINRNAASAQPSYWQLVDVGPPLDWRAVNLP